MAGIQKRLKEIENEEQDPNIFADFSKVKQLGTEKKSLSNVLNKINLTTREIQDLKDLYSLLTTENSGESEWAEFSAEFRKAKKDVESLYEETLYSEANDNCSALVVLHAGAGGEEAQDWTDMLLRMYTGLQTKTICH